MKESYNMCIKKILILMLTLRAIELRLRLLKFVFMVLTFSVKSANYFIFTWQKRRVLNWPSVILLKKDESSTFYFFNNKRSLSTFLKLLYSFILLVFLFKNRWFNYLQLFSLMDSIFIFIILLQKKLKIKMSCRVWKYTLYFQWIETFI